MEDKFRASDGAHKDAPTCENIETRMSGGLITLRIEYKREGHSVST